MLTRKLTFTNYFKKSCLVTPFVLLCTFQCLLSKYVPHLLVDIQSLMNTSKIVFSLLNLRYMTNVLCSQTFF
jgi:hypothetical protein